MRLSRFHESESFIEKSLSADRLAQIDLPGRRQKCSRVPNEDSTGNSCISRTVFLVSCVATKGSSECAARDLYRSVWFKKARNHVESTGCKWFILSAKYGLVHPDQFIEPYDQTLNTMSVEARRDWANRVIEQIDANLPPAGNFILLAGARYRDHLQPLLEHSGAKVTVPMLGLTQGRQLHWFDTHRPRVETE
ncbi:MAG: DUF6884 domain-containing protein [Thiobacillaceae bacterium]